MWAWAGLLLILTQLGISGWAYAAGEAAVFTLFFTDLSPVVLFFTLLEKVNIHIGLRTSSYLIFSLAWNMLKYVSYLCAFNADPENKKLIFSLFLEAVYIALATAGLFYFVAETPAV